MTAKSATLSNYSGDDGDARVAMFDAYCGTATALVRGEDQFRLSPPRNFHFHHHSRCEIIAQGWCVRRYYDINGSAEIPSAPEVWSMKSP